MSLYNLVSVVSQLRKKERVNYRNSKLTMLLSDSIGGNCMTTLLGMVSPSQQYCAESNNTLAFATACSEVQNVVKKNKYRNSIPASVPVPKKVPEKKAVLPWRDIKFERE